ncbi:MAG: CRISPR-associated helicase Cas3' [Candidatus Helarchaeota archaeon]
MTILKHIWGKARKNLGNGDLQYKFHPLICHLIDVAAVAEVYWDTVLSVYVKNLISSYLFKNSERAKKWLTFLAGIHDIGKATPIFQSKVPELSNNLYKIFRLKCFSIPKYHSILSAEILDRYLNCEDSKIKIEDPVLKDSLKNILSGHHGAFSRSNSFAEIIPPYIGTGPWEQIQLEIIQLVLDFCGLTQDRLTVTPLSKDLSIDEKFKALLIFIAGFISVVDWIGSNEEFFDYYNDFNNGADLKAKYFQLSRARAKKAIHKIGWVNWQNACNTTVLLFREIFPFIRELRPLQTQVVENIQTLKNPCLIIIEAPMGEGKTEAALYLEHYLEVTHSLQGAYIALPTQATANQMFNRVQSFLKNTKKGLRINLHLLHGHATLSEEYSLLKTKSKNFDEQESAIVADEWFTYRKRGLISPFGVGTIDQVLLSVLSLKHFFVRLFGLAGKIIIIDEVHSYDIYMSTIMEKLLYWLKLLGSSVILLSATLPSSKRKKLIQTFSGAIGTNPEAPYPRITICRENEVTSTSFDVQLKKQYDNSIKISWIEEDRIANLLKERLKNGGKAAIICNKVRRAQNLYLQLKGALENLGVQLDLLHARYPYSWRDEIEQTILKKYGKNREISEKAHVLVSTQIIEQSLDLDFDIMISDFAPIDLLFQRMGRLHRHTHDITGNPIHRPTELTPPQFIIIKPKLNEFSIPQFSYPIYSREILLRTFLHIWHVPRISIPDDIEPMIEAVYSEQCIIPPEFEHRRVQWELELQNAKDKQQKRNLSKESKAYARLIPDPSDEDFFDSFSLYLKDDTSEAQQSFHSLTRITLPSINLICLYKLPEGLFLDPDKTIPIDLQKPIDSETAKTLLNYAIKVTHSLLFHHFTQNKHSIPQTWKENSILRNCHSVILSHDNNSDLFFFEIENVRAYLCKDLGLYIQKKDGA